MKIAVLGTGYVGLVSGVCLAAKGHGVACLDQSKNVVDLINGGEAHIHEKGLTGLMREMLAAGRFRAAPVSTDALAGHRVIVIAVGTPSVRGRIDLAQIEAASRMVGRYLRESKSYTTVVVKSTVVPGTTDTAVRGWIEKESGKELGQFGLGMNPEFLREGDAVSDFMNPDRIVLGCETEQTWEDLQELYLPWQCEKIRVNTRTAEMIKYANNAVLATQISMVNELANIAAAVGGIDIHEVMTAIHADKRWSPLLPSGERIHPGILEYLWPGCGFGGSCFPKDVQALHSVARDAGQEPLLLSAVLEVNARQPHQVVSLLRRSKVLKGKHFLVLGLAFKPDTDDVRESTSRIIIEDLLSEGVKVTAHDPIAMTNARKSWPDLSIAYAKDWVSQVCKADGVIVATRWPEYERLKAPDIQILMKDKIVFDARGMFQINDFPGATYLRIGCRLPASCSLSQRQQVKDGGPL